MLDYIYPRRCPVCGGIVVPKGKKVCDTCTETFQVIKQPRCMKCSKPVEQEEQEYCYDCSNNSFHYTKGLALWVYDKNVKKSIADFKYHNRKEYSSYYVQEIMNHLSKDIIKLAPDLLVPVPLHKRKLKERGFNQAYLLAKGIAENLRIPVSGDYLLRVHKTRAQKQLNDKERTNNMSGAFCINPMIEASKHDRVMLVDDIYTTGSTIDECAKVLLDSGTKEVYFVSLSIGKGY